MDSGRGDGTSSRRVSPFGHPRVDACSSLPGLIAAYNALHRLPAPRHPPCALSSLTFEHYVKECSEKRSNARYPTAQLSKTTGTATKSSSHSLCEPPIHPSRPPHTTELVEVSGIEPLTPCLQSRCSTDLSYTPTIGHGSVGGGPR